MLKNIACMIGSLTWALSATSGIAVAEDRDFADTAVVCNATMPTGADDGPDGSVNLTENVKIRILTDSTVMDEVSTNPNMPALLITDSQDGSDLALGALTGILNLENPIGTFVARGKRVRYSLTIRNGKDQSQFIAEYLENGTWIRDVGAATCKLIQYSSVGGHN